MSAYTSSPHALSIQKLEIWRGDRCLCRGLDCQVTAGEAVHVQGPNGSGKTTLIRVLTGLGRADGGEVRWNGHPLRETGVEYRASLAYLGHANGVKLGLTPRENLVVAGAMLAETPTVDVDTALMQVGLRHQADLPCGMLSMGQRRRTALARLLLSRAPVWFLDEPLTSLDAEGATCLTSMLKQHLADNGLAVFATHQPLDLRPFPVHSLVLSAAA